MCVCMCMTCVCVSGGIYRVNTMEALLKAINTKVQLLEIKTSKSKDVTEKRKVETIERHRDKFKILSKEVNELRIKIEQEKL